MSFLNRVKVTVTTQGQATSLSFGPALAGYQTFEQAGVLDGESYSYTIEDGSAFELGVGLYNATAKTLTREMYQSSTGSLLNLSGTAILFITALAEDIDDIETLALCGL